ncbi:MAG TPA: PqqD family protein, partial [Planctomycetaceae bacterium]|nr:PqqD family protein [Planctomycetaceae bacterium]
MVAPAAKTEDRGGLLRLKLRTDLIVQPQVYEGQIHYVVKDPVGMRYFRFREEVYFIIQRLDGTRRLKDLKEEYEQEFPPQQVTIEELAKFVAQLSEAGLVHVDRPGQGKILYKRHRKNKLKRRLMQFTNILYIKLPGIDPERLLTRMLPYFRWAFHPITVAATVFLWIMALLWLAAHYDTFL